MRIGGRTALVTGGASGLGAAAARMILEAGGKAVIADLKPQAPEAFLSALQPLDASPGSGGAGWSPQAMFVQTDVTSADAMQAAVQAAIESFGGLDILIHCAGVADAAKVAGKDGPASLDHFSKLININLIGTFNAIRLAAAKMLQNEPNEEGERGVIVCTASVAAFDGQIGQAAYAASKGGVVSMTLPVARELARYGIRVVTIAPGIFDTPMMAAMPEPVRESLGKSVPFPPRLGRPAEYAQLARQIIENPMLNGATIRLDGAIRMPPR
jgi:NAD(P)-dependent dehydrogenase (short-subunit alcohol dehydrogenase family)